jgi:5-formyltetrahydrofolate cyclo-ligase
MLEKRTHVLQEMRQNAAFNALQLLKKTILFNDAKEIAFYLAKGNEFDCQSIIEESWKQQKTCYLPVLTPEKKLNFSIYTSHIKLMPNQYQILEPHNSPFQKADMLDLVLLPLVGFDRKGHRLGMGGGFYDRTFEFLLSSSKKKPFLLGIAFSFQEVDSLPSDSWDVNLNGILTEKEVIFIE